VSETSSSRIPREAVAAGDRAAARRALRARRAAETAQARWVADHAVFAAVGQWIAAWTGDHARPGDAPGPAGDAGEGAQAVSTEVPTTPIVAVYWPMAGEPDPREAMARWHRDGWALALPVVRERAAPLDFRAWAPGDPLEPGLLGTWQPREVVECRPDLLVIPCLGFDARGYRLGYGGGFYDRTLAAFEQAGPRVATLGVARDDAQLVGFEPQAHDCPLDAIVTESRRFPSRPARP
jgi:5,10-methenyltetrahydrofolate synthetase